MSEAARVGRYPVMLDLQDRPCLVVGGGEVATRRVLGLLAVEAAVTVHAPTLSAPLAELAGSGRIAWIEGAYSGLGSPAGAPAWAFVVAATDDMAVNRTVVDQASRVGVLASDTSDPTGGPAATPSTRRVGPVTLAVSTDGIHPAASRWLADRAAADIPAEVLVALELVDEVRFDDLAGGGTGARPDWRMAVESGMLDLIRAGHLAEAKERLQACLSSSSD